MMRMVKHFVPVIAWLLIALWVGPQSAWAQATSTGSVAGVVTDPSNAVISGATVTLKEASTGRTQSGTTNENGRYIFPNISPGSYEISISKTGFATTRT